MTLPINPEDLKEFKWKKHVQNNLVIINITTSMTFAMLFTAFITFIILK